MVCIFVLYWRVWQPLFLCIENLRIKDSIFIVFWKYLGNQKTYPYQYFRKCSLRPYDKNFYVFWDKMDGFAASLRDLKIIIFLLDIFILSILFFQLFKFLNHFIYNHSIFVNVRLSIQFLKLCFYEFLFLLQFTELSVLIIHKSNI